VFVTHDTGRHLNCYGVEHIVRNVPGKLEELAGSDQPFYLQIGTFQTHSPYDRDDAKPDDTRGVYVPPQYLENAAVGDPILRGPMSWPYYEASLAAFKASAADTF